MVEILLLQSLIIISSHSLSLLETDYSSVNTTFDFSSVAKSRVIFICHCVMCPWPLSYGHLGLLLRVCYLKQVGLPASGSVRRYPVTGGGCLCPVGRQGFVLLCNTDNTFWIPVSPEDFFFIVQENHCIRLYGVIQKIEQKKKSHIANKHPSQKRLMNSGNTLKSSLLTWQ